MFTFSSLLSVTNFGERSCSLAAGRGAEPSLPGTGQVLLCASLSAQLVAVRHRAVAALRVPSFGAAMLSGAPSADDACCSATPLHGSGLSSGAPVAAATSAGVMRAHFGARYTWPRRCCAGCRTAAADHLLLETMGCAAVGRSFVMSSNSTEAWDAQEWAVIELQHHPCRPFGPYPLALQPFRPFARIHGASPSGSRTRGGARDGGALGFGSSRYAHIDAGPSGDCRPLVFA